MFLDFVFASDGYFLGNSSLMTERLVNATDMQRLQFHGAIIGRPVADSSIGAASSRRHAARTALAKTVENFRNAMVVTAGELS
ncbi:hypothetical protein [Ensifer sp. LCM 4579]|uniref:hypothetical protein n=1 Tax=Ensifer sp. LCM 4579 TaxID=1848292 RepID=UPI00155E07DB|nr:hypothetical protein [Ensifer sp. LCM 4579]